MSDFSCVVINSDRSCLSLPDHRMQNDFSTPIPYTLHLSQHILSFFFLSTVFRTLKNDKRCIPVVHKSPSSPREPPHEFSAQWFLQWTLLFSPDLQPSLTLFSWTVEWYLHAMNYYSRCDFIWIRIESGTCIFMHRNALHLILTSKFI